MGETFVTVVFNNLMALMPFVIVRSYQRGVRWRFGRHAISLEPGIHLKIWVYHQIEVSDVTDEFIELPIQSVVTKDEKLVCFSANVGYRIEDIVKHWENVQDFVESTHGAAMTHLAAKVREKTLSELVSDLKSLEKSLENTLTTRFKAWGTKVICVGFTNFAEVPTQIRLFVGETKLMPHSATH